MSEEEALRFSQGARADICADKPLGRVYVYLRLYSMNTIDDFSSFLWSLPLRSKDETGTHTDSVAPCA